MAQPEHFDKLQTPNTWQQYWTRYPQGYTILEALIHFVSQVNEMVENVNDWNDYLDEFVETFDKKLHPHVKEILTKMLEDGTLEDIINEAVIGELTNGQPDTHLWGELERRGVNVKWFGAVGDGVTDDTQAIQDAINRGGSNIIVFPEGVYCCKDLKLKDGTVLTSGHFNGEEYRTQGNVTLLAHFDATNVLDVDGVEGWGIYGITIYGNECNASGVRGGSRGGKIVHCKIENCDVGIGSAASIYTRTMLVEGCYISKNRIGVNNIVDSKVVNSFIYSNDTGIKLGEGANDNIIDSNKIEWNNTQGVENYSNKNNIFTSNVIDRNGSAGLNFNLCEHSVVNGNVFRRNGGMDERPGFQSHIRIQNSKAITLNGVMTKVDYSEDGGTGEIVPPRALTLFDSEDIIIAGCNLKGGTIESKDAYNNVNVVEVGNIEISTG